LDAAYGDSGRVTCSSEFGSVSGFPYAEVEPAYTSRRTPFSRAASNTFNVPVAFTWWVTSGSSTDRCTDVTAA